MSAVEGWEQKKFSELGVCIRGVCYKPENLEVASTKENFTLLRSNNIKNSRLIFHDLQFVNSSAVRENQKLKNQDIAICMSNGNRALVGKSGVFLERGDNNSYTVGAFCSIFRPSKGFDASYIRYLFGSSSYQKQLDGILSGSAINNLNGSNIDNLEALCPISINEQTKIAEILSCIDTAIEQTEAIIAKQQRIKTGLMQDLLSKGIDEYGNIRSEQNHAFKDSPLGRIPVEWKIKSLETITSHVIDCPHTTPFFVAGGVLVARTFNIKDGSFIDTNASYVTEAEFKERNARLEPKTGDIIFTREAPVGEAFVIPDGMRICLGQRTMLVRCESKDCIPDYLIETIYSQKMRIRFDQMVGGTTNPHLNVADVRKLLIILPQVQEQERISKMLTINRRALNDLQSNKYKLEKLKTALMQDLLSGNVRVNPLLSQQ